MSESLKPVIFVSPYRSTLPLVKPLMEAGYDVCLPDNNWAQRMATNLSLQMFINHDVQMQAVSQATVLAGRILAGMQQEVIPNRLTDFMQTANMSMNGTGRDDVVDHVARGFMQWFPGWTHQSMTRQIVTLKAMENLCGYRDVRAVVVQNDVEEFTKAITLYSVAHGIPSIHIPHSVYLDWGHGEPGFDVHDVVSADWIYCAGWFQAEWYKRRGAKRLQVVGVPHWDGHATRAKEDNKAEIQRRLKLNPKKPVVAYFSSWRQDTAAAGFHDGVEVAYRAMLQVAREASEKAGWQLVVKTHPSAQVENAEWHAKQIQTEDLKAIVTDQYLDLILKAQDVAVVYGTSNTAIESAIYGVPLVSINGFADDEAVITCSDEPEELDKAVKQALSKRWQKKYEKDLRKPFIQKYAGAVDGEATQRCIEGILRLAGKGR